MPTLLKPSLLLSQATNDDVSQHVGKVNGNLRNLRGCVIWLFAPYTCVN